jgi:para-nitrobenzyl esterase
MKKTLIAAASLFLIAVGVLTGAARALPLPTVLKPIEPVKTDGGLVAGKVLASGVRAWFGVPYAKAPVQELRWREPQRIAWEGPYNADRFAPQCIQPLRGSRTNFLHLGTHD